jgi:hypothetical protein
VLVASGAYVTLGAFVASGMLPAGISLRVMIDSPGADIEFTQLRRSHPIVVLSGPGTFRVIRDDITSGGVDVGAWTES